MPSPEASTLRLGRHLKEAGRRASRQRNLRRTHYLNRGLKKEAGRLIRMSNVITLKSPFRDSPKTRECFSRIKMGRSRQHEGHQMLRPGGQGPELRGLDHQAQHRQPGSSHRAQRRELPPGMLPTYKTAPKLKSKPYLKLFSYLLT